MDFFTNSVVVSYPSTLSTSTPTFLYPFTQPNLSFSMTRPVISQKNLDFFMDHAILYTDKPTLNSILYK